MAKAVGGGGGACWFQGNSKCACAGRPNGSARGGIMVDAPGRGCLSVFISIPAGTGGAAGSAAPAVGGNGASMVASGGAMPRSSSDAEGCGGAGTAQPRAGGASGGSAATNGVAPVGLGAGGWAVAAGSEGGTTLGAAATNMGGSVGMSGATGGSGQSSGRQGRGRRLQNRDVHGKHRGGVAGGAPRPGCGCQRRVHEVQHRGARTGECRWNAGTGEPCRNPRGHKGSHGHVHTRGEIGAGEPWHHSRQLGVWRRQAGRPGSCGSTHGGGQGRESGVALRRTRGGDGRSHGRRGRSSWRNRRWVGASGRPRRTEGGQAGP
ncbi:uncharacterized PE-PGRS family protein PE_PGRS20-like [Prinia subflava]|uniref:uncharacterized PE-PGRS family protein PE_PGRS20-like n=1 Tax=Prinia subflava TaxID=208062 RepID=UPI002FE15B48